jgi:hypothetical protein
MLWSVFVAVIAHLATILYLAYCYRSIPIPEEDDEDNSPPSSTPEDPRFPNGGSNHRSWIPPRWTAKRHIGRDGGAMVIRTRMRATRTSIAIAEAMLWGNLGP